MNTKELERKGRYLSKLLRHSPEDENLSMDEYGYVRVKDVCNALKIDHDELDWIVENNNKRRFAYKSGMKQFIKATQGHSLDIKFELEPVEPPQYLWHGTTSTNKKKINEFGLQKMSRHHVHLTKDLGVAEQVGMRYAKHKHYLWIITIEAKRMWEDGFEFFVTENGVWLTDHVPSRYFKENG